MSDNKVVALRVEKALFLLLGVALGLILGIFLTDKLETHKKERFGSYDERSGFLGDDLSWFYATRDTIRGRFVLLCENGVGVQYTAEGINVYQRSGSGVGEPVLVKDRKGEGVIFVIVTVDRDVFYFNENGPFD